MNQQTFDFVPSLEPWKHIKFTPMCPHCSSIRLILYCSAVAHMEQGEVVKITRTEYDDSTQVVCADCGRAGTFGTFYLAGKYKTMMEDK